MKKMICVRLTAVLLLLSCLAFPANAEENSYCFSETDFAQELLGICLQQLPEDGVLMLDDRQLRPGDVLTREQAARMTFYGDHAGKEGISYLPVFAEGVEDRETAIFSVRSKKNQPPVAEDSAAETYKNLENDGSLRVRDPEGQELTFTVIREPRRGTVTIRPDGSFTYTPKKNKVGVDSFSYTAADPEGNVSREATVTVTILKPSDMAKYQDTAALSCEFAAEWMKNTGIFVSESMGDASCFQPDKPLSMGEFLPMLLKTLKIPEEENSQLLGDSVPMWLQPYAAAALRSGLTAGLPDRESFSESVVQEEAAVMLQNALNLPVPAFSREEGIPQWAESSLAALREQGIFLDAGQILTRGKAAELLYEVHLLKQG